MRTIFDIQLSGSRMRFWGPQAGPCPLAIVSSALTALGRQLEALAAARFARADARATRCRE